MPRPHKRGKAVYITHCGEELNVVRTNFLYMQTEACTKPVPHLCTHLGTFTQVSIDFSFTLKSTDKNNVGKESTTKRHQKSTEAC